MFGLPRSIQPHDNSTVLSAGGGIVPGTPDLEVGRANSNQIQSFKDLIVWQKAFQLCLDIYRGTHAFPTEERFGLTAELRKTSRSDIYNIAEGHKRRSTTEYLRFLDIASGSRAELLAALARALRSKAGRTKP